MPEVQIAFNEASVFDDFCSHFPLAGKRIVEVGGRLPLPYMQREKAAEWIAIDPLNADAECTANYKTVRGTADCIHYRNGYFDFAFSSNAFQHIHNLEATLAELHRVLKYNGIVYAHFGPIWSAPDGSHIENLEHEGMLYNFWEKPLVPAWFHLLYSPDELYEILCSGISSSLAARVVDYIMQSTWINRYFFEDYLRIFYESPFSIKSFITEDKIDYPFHLPVYKHPLIRELDEYGIGERICTQCGGGKRNIFCRDIRIILQKTG